MVDAINETNLDYKNVEGQQRATLTGGDMMKSFVVPRDPKDGEHSRYEKAPGEDINDHAMLAQTDSNQSAD